MDLSDFSKLFIILQSYIQFLNLQYDLYPYQSIEIAVIEVINILVFKSEHHIIFILPVIFLTLL